MYHVNNVNNNIFRILTLDWITHSTGNFYISITDSEINDWNLYSKFNFSGVNQDDLPEITVLLFKNTVIMQGLTQ